MSPIPANRPIRKNVVKYTTLKSRKKTKKSNLPPVAIVFLGLVTFFTIFLSDDTKQHIIPQLAQSPTATSAPTVTPIPRAHTIEQKFHTFQSYNNCGPATLSMALSYQGIQKSQEELGLILRPYQIPGGDNDDKSVTLEEVANLAKSYGLISLLRPNGDIETLKKLIANEIPVITRTWLGPDEDIGHYRVIRGYDDATQTLIQDDSYQGGNLTYSYAEFEKLWQPFNFEYLVLVKPDQKELVRKILGEDYDEKTAWQNALERISDDRKSEPENWHLTFALSRIYYHLGDYRKAVEEYNKVENLISFRTLWYQTEPLMAIYKTGDIERVLGITDSILNNHNKAFSELYILRGDIYKKSGNIELATQEYQLAAYYNQNNEDAKKRLTTLQ